jgi:hypothetical protein
MCDRTSGEVDASYLTRGTAISSPTKTSTPATVPVPALLVEDVVPDVDGVPEEEEEEEEVEEPEAEEGEEEDPEEEEGDEGVLGGSKEGVKVGRGGGGEGGGGEGDTCTGHTGYIWIHTHRGSMKSNMCTLSHNMNIECWCSPSSAIHARNTKLPEGQ